jgi:hypothetical protein
MKRSFSDAHDDRGRKRTAKPGDAGANGVKLREGKVVQPDDEVVKTFALATGGMVYARADRDTGISRKVRRAGKAGCPAPPVVTEACVHFYFTLHARPSDAADIRLSLRPLLFEARE